MRVPENLTRARVLTILINALTQLRPRRARRLRRPHPPGIPLPAPTGRRNETGPQRPRRTRSKWLSPPASGRADLAAKRGHPQGTKTRINRCQPGKPGRQLNRVSVDTSAITLIATQLLKTVCRKEVASRKPRVCTLPPNLCTCFRFRQGHDHRCDVGPILSSLIHGPLPVGSRPASLRIARGRFPTGAA